MFKFSLNWIKAEEDEMRKLAKFNTFKEVDDNVHESGFPLNALIWSYRIKTDADGNEEFRARVCFNGSKEERDCYGNVTSPVIKPLSMQLISITAAHNKWPLRNSDVDSAFVQVVNPRKVFCHYPKGMEKPGKCLQIIKFLYGQKGAPRSFKEALSAFLISIGGQVSTQDECLFIFDLYSPEHSTEEEKKREAANQLLGVMLGDTEGKVKSKFEYDKSYQGPTKAYVGTYVDDLKYTGPPWFCKQFEAFLSERFPTKIMGEERKFVGVETKGNVEEQWIEHGMEQTILSFAEKFQLHNCKHTETPMEHGQTLFPCSEEEIKQGEMLNPILKQEYQSKVGSCMHLTTNVREDIAFATKECSRHMQHPGKKHMVAVNRIIKYLVSTASKCKRFDCRKPLEDDIIALVDSSSAGPWDARSTSSATVIGNGAPLTHLCKLQKLPEHSSCEAELIAVDDLVREVVWMINLMKEFCMVVTKPLLILEDNQSTISLCYNKVQQQRSKHIDVRYFYIRHLIQCGLCRVKYIPSEANTADCGTKSLGKILFQKHVDVLFGHAKVELDRVKTIR